MSGIDMDTLSMLQAASDPTSTTFNRMMSDLMDAAGGSMAAQDPDSDGQREWRRVFPFCGSAVENRTIVEKYPDFSLSKYPTYTQGVLSLVSLFDRMANLFQNATRNKSNRVLFVSSYAQQLCDMFAASDPGVDFVDYCHTSGVPAALTRTSGYTVLVYDHTTCGTDLQAILEAAYAAGVKIVEGLLWYSPAVDHGWTGVYGDEKILISHTTDGLNIGPADDPTRVLYFPRASYAKFTYPSLLRGKAATFYYEFKYVGNFGLYTAYNIGTAPAEVVKFRLPYSTDPDLIVVAIDRRFADGVFSVRQPDNKASGSADVVNGNGSWLFSSRRDYFFQVRKKLFEDAVMFLVGKTKGTDLMTEAVRYVTAHNYSDLFEGSRIVTAYASSYTDALCLSTVVALQAYVHRYNLTRESMRTLMDVKYQANALSGAIPLGLLGKLTTALVRYAKFATVDNVNAALVRAKRAVTSSDLIPGVFYDVYVDRTYEVGGTWVEHRPRAYDTGEDLPRLDLDDPITDFMGGKVDVSAPSYLIDEDAEKTLRSHLYEIEKRVTQPVKEPVKKLQDVYDSAFPGNSVADLANVAELRKTRDINTRLEFSGRIQINMDKPRVENLYHDMPMRTSALPVGRSGLLDALFASAKRNFSVPDIHTVSDAFAFARRLVREFIEHACIPGAAQICKQYREQPLEFNVTAYCEWAAGKSEAYRNALYGEMPDEMVTLGLSKYTSILKGRIKPKLSVTAQRELGQPQVVVHQTKKETALFSSVFRKAFTRFDSILRDEFFSAGQASDEEISSWATRMGKKLMESLLLEGDSSMYDKSQGLLAMMIEVCMMLELGVAPSVINVLQQTFVGGVTSAMAGLMFILALQRKSGHGDTMFANIVYNGVSIGHSVGWHRIRCSVKKGDDNVLALDPATFSGDDAAEVAAKMGMYFNLETKIIVHEVPGFSSGGFVPVGEKILFFPDPLKLLELLGERQINPGPTMREQFASFQDKVSVFEGVGVPEAVQEWTRKRYRISSDIVGAIEALITISRDFTTFSLIKDPQR